MTRAEKPDIANDPFVRSDHSRKAALVTAIAFACLHVGIWTLDFHGESEGGWRGFLTFIVDLPVSIPLLILSRKVWGLWHRVDILILVAGTAWWFFLGRLLSSPLLDLINLVRHFIEDIRLNLKRVD